MSNGLQDEVASVVDRFFMGAMDLRILDVVRRCYAVLLLLNVGLLWPDRHLFFGQDSYLPAEVVFDLVDADTFNLYSFVPDSPLAITLALGLLAAAGLALLVGWFPRIAALVAFVLLVCVQHANIMLFDGEDIVFRLFAFFLIFVPPWRKLQPAPCDVGNDPATARGYPAWPLRLFQLQICIIYFCTAIQKSNGSPWLDGTAIYFAIRLDDMTKFALPEVISESIGWLKVLTWSTMLFEFAAPLLIWWRKTRWFCIVSAVLFHLGTDYAMNLHLFHWIMITGLLSFVRYDELEAAARWVKSLFGKQEPEKQAQ